MTEQKQPEAEAAGFLNPFKWGKKKEESKADKAAANPPKVDSTTPTPTPTAPESTPVPAAAKKHTVVAGDTLWDIAVKYYGDGRKYTKIASANNIPNPNLINIGMELTIPD